jgi:hypothetical protein
MRPILARMILVSLVAVFYAVVGPVAWGQTRQSPLVHHDLAVTIDPATHHIRVRDRIRVPGALVTAPFTISLNAALNPQAVPGGLKLLPIGSRMQGSESGIDRNDHNPASRVPVNVYGVEGRVIERRSS